VSTRDREAIVAWLVAERDRLAELPAARSDYPRYSALADGLEAIASLIADCPVACEPARAEVDGAALSNADDLRAAGWAVAVHNDYRLAGEHHTFWLLTKDDRCVKGEGRTDSEALEVIRRALLDAEAAGEASATTKGDGQ
jgi:hypothetical protein